MSENKIMFFAVFSSICAAGVFVGFASGIQWGTDACGVLSSLTLIILG